VVSRLVNKDVIWRSGGQHECQVHTEHFLWMQKQAEWTVLEGRYFKHICDLRVYCCEQ
jgi:hypothetical protein